ncbi:reverse transcriptase domain-containing protein [Tanacetum coccineum]
MTIVKNENDELIMQRTVTGWRVCIDYRKLNNATRKDHFTLPFIDQMLERLAGHEYYCFLDGFFGYFQIPIAFEDQEKTTFTCPYRTFAYKRMPYGLCNATTTFQHCMTAIFHELIEDNIEEKCHFIVKEGIVLSHKVSGSGIEVDKAKNQGHTGFYRRFTKDFSQIARPMTQLLVKDAPFNFTEECIQAFDTLKRELTHAQIMIKPDWSLPFEIMCDASDYAVRVVLGQRIDKHFNPIHYASKIMNEAQENYTTTEKELLAVVFAFDKFCQYLVLSKTIIRDKKGAENLAADHLSWLENPDLGKLTKAEIRDLFREERLMAISDKNNEPCLLGHKNYYMDLTKAGENQFLQIKELDEMRLDAYESSISYKERTKRPFSVSKDMKNRAIELYDEEGSEFIVNKQRVKPYQKNILDINRDDDITLEDEGEVT